MQIHVKNIKTSQNKESPNVQLMRICTGWKRRPWCAAHGKLLHRTHLWGCQGLRMKLCYLMGEGHGVCLLGFVNTHAYGHVEGLGLNSLRENRE